MRMSFFLPENPTRKYRPKILPEILPEKIFLIPRKIGCKMRADMV